MCFFTQLTEIVETNNSYMLLSVSIFTIT